MPTPVRARRCAAALGRPLPNRRQRFARLLREGNVFAIRGLLLLAPETIGSSLRDSRPAPPLLRSLPATARAFRAVQATFPVLRIEFPVLRAEFPVLRVEFPLLLVEFLVRRVQFRAPFSSTLVLIEKTLVNLVAFRVPFSAAPARSSTFPPLVARFP